MRLFQKLVLLTGFALLFTAVGMYISLQMQGEDSPAGSAAFASAIEGDIDLMIVGAAADVVSLQGEIAALDQDRLVATGALADDPRDADAVIVLLSSWDELATAPWQDELAGVYGNAQRMAGDTVAVTVTRSLFDREMHFTIYNTQHYADWGMTCYAALFLHHVGEAEETSFLPPADCPI